MRIVLRIPKRQVRVAATAAVVVGLGAGVGVAAQPEAKLLGESAGAATALPVPALPHDRTLPLEQHPEERLKTAPRVEASSAALEPVQEPAQEPQTQEPAGAPQNQQEPPVQDPAQDPAQEQEEQQAPPPAPAGNRPLMSQDEQDALALVEQIIREQEGVLMGREFDYSVQGRRDPFQSLLLQVGVVAAPTVRPPGLAGFLVDEIELKGIATANGRWHAMVIGSNQRAYFIEVGTQLYDGHVVDIRPGEVLFEQVVTDALGARRTREVTKRLRPTDGGGQTP